LVYLVYFVYLVCLVDFVCLVYLVYLVWSVDSVYSGEFLHFRPSQGGAVMRRCGAAGKYKCCDFEDGITLRGSGALSCTLRRRVDRNEWWKLPFIFVSDIFMQ